MSGFTDDFYRSASAACRERLLPAKPSFYNTREQPDVWRERALSTPVPKPAAKPRAAKTRGRSPRRETREQPDVWHARRGFRTPLARGSPFSRALKKAATEADLGSP